MKNLKFLVSIMIVPLIACTGTTIKKELTFNALIFDNQSGSMLENVRVSVDKTGAFISCGVVHRGPSCSASFRPKIYQGNPVRLSWQMRGDTYSLGPIDVGLPEILDSSRPASIIIRLGLGNDITTKFAYEDQTVILYR